MVDEASFAENPQVPRNAGLVDVDGANQVTHGLLAACQASTMRNRVGSANIWNCCIIMHMYLYAYSESSRSTQGMPRAKCVWRSVTTIPSAFGFRPSEWRLPNPIPFVCRNETAAFGKSLKCPEWQYGGAERSFGSPHGFPAPQKKWALNPLQGSAHSIPENTSVITGCLNSHLRVEARDSELGYEIQ